MPRVSIITPCYNCDRYIADTIASVQAQTFADWEHIIVDDGSSDQSAAVVQTYLPQDQRLQLRQQPNQGVASARNAGVAAAANHSDYLFFLDADDCLAPEMLNIVTTYLDQHPNVGLAYCDYNYIDAVGEPIATPSFSRYVPHLLGVRQLTDTDIATPFISVFAPAVILPSVSIIRRSVYEQTPGWDEQFGQPFEDTDINLQIALRSQIHYIPHKLVNHRRHGTQSTSSQMRLAQQEKHLYQKWLNLGDLTPPQKQLVKTAWWFRQGRLLPYIGVQAGYRHLKQGEIRLALRFYGGAIRRYLWSFLPGGLPKLEPLRAIESEEVA
jgi:glycosyltransferase involved in cell wall biosynthesis